MRASLPRVDRVTGRRHFLRMLMTPLRRCSVQPAGSMIGRWWVAALAVVAGAACSDASGPGPNDFYEWRLIVASPGGTGDDSLTFHWPQNRLPVRIWVEDAADLPGHVAAGLTAWRQGLTQSQFAGEVVSDSTTADVIVRAGVGPGRAVRTRPHAQRPRARVLRRDRLGRYPRSHPAPPPGPDLRRSERPTRPRLGSRSAWRSPRPTSSGTRSASGATRSRAAI